MAPEPRRKRRPLVAALGVLALAGAGYTGDQTAEIYRTSHSPKAAVERYFEALQSGDAKAALGLAENPPKSPWLTGTVLREQLKVASIGGVDIRPVSSTSTAAVVEARYKLQFHDGSRAISDRIQLVKRGDHWRLVSATGAARIDAVGPGADRATIAGRPLRDGVVIMFPGAIPVQTDSPYVVIDSHPFLPLTRSTDAIRIEPELSDEAKRKVATAVDAALATCLTSARPDPHCPAPVSGRVVPGSLRGTATSRFAKDGASVDLAAQGKGLIAFGAQITVNGTWKYWDFNNQVKTGKGDLRLNVLARSSINDMSMVVWGAE